MAPTKHLVQKEMGKRSQDYTNNAACIQTQESKSQGFGSITGPSVRRHIFFFSSIFSLVDYLGQMWCLDEERYAAKRI